MIKPYGTKPATVAASNYLTYHLPVEPRLSSSHKKSPFETTRPLDIRCSGQSRGIVACARPSTDRTATECTCGAAGLAEADWPAWRSRAQRGYPHPLADWALRSRTLDAARIPWNHQRQRISRHDGLHVQLRESRTLNPSVANLVRSAVKDADGFQLRCSR